MKRLTIPFVIITCLLIAGVAVAQKSKPPDYEALAQKLVTQCANIKEGQLVWIYGSVRDLQLLENIAVHVRKVGAFPMISISGDRLERRMYIDVPAKYDTQLNEMDKVVLSAVDAVISVETGETAGLLADVPAERRAARAKAGEELNQIYMKRNIKGVNLGNDLYPTAQRAKRFDISQKELTRIFWAGVNTDYEKLQATGQSLKELLAKAKEVEITTPSGTNLKLNITGRPIHISDGIISEADLKEGVGSSNVWLPAGEVMTTPIRGSAQGKIVIDKYFFQGKDIKKLTLDFKDGKITSMTAASGIEPLKAYFDAASGGKDEFASIDLGINPDVKIPPGSSMVTWMSAGTVTLGLGDNQFLGGEISSTFGLALFLTNCTLKLDGKIIIEKGKLKI